MEIKVCCPVLCTHQTQIMAGSLCRNELRHWRELMTEKAGLRGLCSSGAPFHHQFVSPGKCCDFLCASVMISCTWLSLHSPVLTGTLSAAFFKSDLSDTISSCTVDILGDSSKPQGAVDLLLNHRVDIAWMWKSLLFVTYWPTSPDSLQIRDIMSSECFHVCVFTPCSIIYSHDTPQEASLLLHSSE